MNILILGGRYANPKYANSICRQNLSEYFVKDGHHVYILASGYEYHGEEETLNGVYVKKIYGDNFGDIHLRYENRKDFMSKIKLKLHQLYFYARSICLFPLSSMNDARETYKYANGIIEREKIDVLLAMYRPYESIDAAIRLKKKHGSSLRVVTYHLDLLSGHTNGPALLQAFRKHRIKVAFQKELEVVDKMLLPFSAPEVKSEKVEYVDFPLYVVNKGMPAENQQHRWMPKESINIGFVGTMDSRNRQPEYVCSLIERLKNIEGREVNLHIWGRLSGVNIEPFKRTIYHGMAKIEDVSSILQQSDFLLNIGNLTAYNMIPSKIFQMFAAKKPILFNVSSPKDKSVPYFEKYGYTCFIKEYDHQDNEDVAIMERFISTHYRDRVDVDDKLFEKSTPQYICQKVLDD